MEDFDLAWLEKLLVLLSEHKVTGIFVFFVFIIYRIINVAYSKAKQEYKESCKTRDIDSTIKMEFERKAIIHNTCLIVMILGFFGIFFSELFWMSGKQKTQKVVREGTLTFTSFSTADQQRIVKMFSDRFKLHYDNVEQEVAWIGIITNKSNRILELDFMILVPQSAVDSLTKSTIPVGQPRQRVVSLAKIPINAKISNDSLLEKTHHYIDTVKYRTIFLNYTGKGRYDFCVLGDRLTISRKCRETEKFAET